MTCLTSIGISQDANGATRPTAPGGSAAREKGLDVLRVVSIGAVIAMHASGFINWASGGIPNPMGGAGSAIIGSLTLGLVTCVSGYVIASHYPISSATAVRAFAARRILRLYPLYAIALTFFWLVWSSDRGVPWALAQYACVGVLLPGAGLGPPVLTLYYVQMVLLFYGLYVVVMSSGSTGAKLARLALCAIGLVLWCAVLRIGDEKIVIYAPSFAYGVAIARWPALGARHGRPLVSAVCAALLIGMVLGAGQAPTWVVLLARAGLPIAAFGPMWSLADRVARLAPSSPLQAAAYGSYGAYLFHRPVLSMLAKLWPSASVVVDILIIGFGGVAASFALGNVIQNSYDSAYRRMVELCARMHGSAGGADTASGHRVVSTQEVAAEEADRSAGSCDGR